MIASEGALPTVAPGVTTFGSGCQTSVSSGFAVGVGDDCWAAIGNARITTVANAKNPEASERMICPVLIES